MAKTASEIFKTFADKDVLVQIAEERQIEITDSVKKNIVKHLTAYVISNGLRKTLAIIPIKLLLPLAGGIEGEGIKTKAVIGKRIFEEMENIGHKTYLEKVDSKILDEILKKVMDVKVPSSSEEKINAFLSEVEIIGLDNFFSKYPTEKLKEFADLCGLVVNSDSREVFIQSLLNQSNYKPKKQKRKEQPSKNKPDIKKGVSVIDLVAHYNRDELAEFLKSEGFPTTGKKRDLAVRIVAHFEGKIKKTDKKRKASDSPSKKSPPSKKARKSSTSTSEKKQQGKKN
jgi:hypothetical protein